MLKDIKNYLEKCLKENNYAGKEPLFCDKKLAVDKISAVMINEIVPQNPKDYFYSDMENPAYMETTTLLFQKAGITVKSIEDITDKGIYLTAAVKTAKEQYAVETDTIKNQLFLLEAELSLFKNLKVIMLMGDVAKKAFNLIAKKNTGKNVIPSGSTYKIRKEKYYYGDIQVFPSYIMTGGNILIEKSKQDMVAEDIGEMMKILSNQY